MEATDDYDEKSAARILGVAPRTLRRWRCDGKVPFHRTPSGRIRYSTDELIKIKRGERVAATNGPLAEHG